MEQRGNQPQINWPVIITVFAALLMILTWIYFDQRIENLQNQ